MNLPAKKLRRHRTSTRVLDTPLRAISACCGLACGTQTCTVAIGCADAATATAGVKRLIKKTMRCFLEKRHHRTQAVHELECVSRSLLGDTKCR